MNDTMKRLLWRTGSLVYKGKRYWHLLSMLIITYASYRPVFTSFRMHIGFQVVALNGLQGISASAEVKFTP